MLNKHLKIDGTNIDITPTFESPFSGYGDHNHPMNTLCHTNIVTESYRYINESLSPVTVISSTGLHLELKAGIKNLNRMVVVKTIEFGADVKLDLANSSRSLGEDGVGFIEYVSNIVERDKGNQTRQITVYYIVDLINIRHEPLGIYLKHIGVTICHREHGDTALTIDNRKVNIVDLEDTDTTTWAGSVTLVHVPVNKINKKPMYTTIGNHLLEIACSDVPGLKPGLHLITQGNIRTSGSNGSMYSLIVEPKDYQLHGFYDSHSQLATSLGGKDRSSEIIALLKEKEANVVNPKRFNILDEIKIGGISLRECADSIGETLGAANNIKREFMTVCK